MLDILFILWKSTVFGKKMLDIICSSYDGDDMYAEFEMVYDTFWYVNPK